jgi:uncharacterized protein (TIGR03067 family)
MNHRRSVLAGFGATLLAACAGAPVQAQAPAQPQAKAKERAFIGTFLIPPERRDGFLRALKDGGFGGAFVPEDGAPDTVLYRGTRAEYDGAVKLMYRLRAEWENRPQPLLKLPVKPGPGDAPAGDAKALKALAGTWHVVEETFDGEKVPAKVAAETSFTFEKDRCTFKGGLAKQGNDWVALNRTDTFTVKLGKGKKFDTLDLVTDAGRTIPAIYRVEVDTLVLCVGFGGERPADFTSDGGKGVAFMKLKQKK